jgi:hypothetical protein
MEELGSLFEFVGGVFEFVSDVAGDLFNSGAGEVAEVVVEMIDSGSDAPPSPEEEERRRQLMQEALNRPAS